MKIKVEQKHIDMGQVRNPYSCPIALAVKEQTGGIFCSVNLSAIWIAGFPDEVFTLPEVAQDFILKFDNKNEVHPFEFEI